MNSLLVPICLSSCILGIVCIFIVIIHNKFNIYSKVLTVSITLSCTMAIALWYFYQGEIPLKENANLALLSAPIYCLPGPLLYLYICSVIAEKKTFNYWHLLHFIPFVFNIVVLIPYYSLPSAERQRIMLNVLYGKPTSVSFQFISTEFDIIIKLLAWFVYLLVTFKLILRFKKRNLEWIKTQKKLWYWLNGLTSISATGFIIYIILLATGYDPKSYSLTLIIPPIFLLNSSVLMLFFTPKVLYGIETKRLEVIAEPNRKTLDLPIQQQLEYKERIETYVQTHKVYLIKNYTIKQLSEDLNISLHHLSYVINNELGTNFQNFINKYRVKYIIENKDKKEWAQFSLEGIGNEAGFNSRNTFFKAFKAVTGKTPAEYLKNDHQD